MPAQAGIPRRRGTQVATSELQTPRLTLRLITPEDAAAITRLMTPEVSRWLANWPTPLTEQAALDRIQLLRAGAARDEIFPYALIRHADNAFIGMIILARTAGHATNGELGYWLGEPFQGAGYMREALTALIQYAFNTQNFTQLEAGAQPKNTASFTTMRAVGLTYAHDRMVFAPARQREELCQFYTINRNS